jgi:hypothetical protein
VNAIGFSLLFAGLDQAANAGYHPAAADVRATFAT